MNWIDELCDLYEKNTKIVGKIELVPRPGKRGDEKTPLILLPIFHTTVAAQITVTIDGEGNFLQADPVQEEDKLTIIPVTDKSASRAGLGKFPHPLCDKLEYVAGDYMRFCPAGVKECSESYRLYIEALRHWQESDFSHQKVNAVYRYVVKGTLIRDLADHGVLKLDELGKMMESEKMLAVSQINAFVRFRVMTTEIAGQGLLSDTTGKYFPECWLDQTLQQSFIEYYRSLPSARGLCYMSGEMTQISYLHPRKIRNEGDGAKLISANDETNFTYRGRFANKEEAFSIGYETSQKAHNALKWIIRRQGRNWDGLCIITWESDLISMPPWDADTDSICDEYESWDEEDGPDPEDDDSTSTWDGNPLGAARFQAALMGYGRRLANLSRMVLIALDAATTGRLAMMEFKDLESTRYLENIGYWHESCEWVHRKYKEGKPGYIYYGMPGVREIADLLYGAEQNGMMALIGKNSRMYAEVCKRLIPCIWDRRDLPGDMVNLAVQRASSPVSFEKRHNWERVLTLACSMVKRQLHDKNNKSGEKEEWKVALNKECTERDYLYGRLLAVADRIEYLTYDDNEKGRQTNARRYMSIFSQRPYQTWAMIEKNLEPYRQKLSPGSRIYYNNLLDKIYQLFDEEIFSDNSRLSGLYLLGFHSQSYDMKHNYKEDEEETKNERAEG